MNKIYKVIWNRVRHCYVVVSEITKNHGKEHSTNLRVSKGLCALTLAIGLSLSSYAFAADTTTGQADTKTNTVVDLGNGGTAAYDGHGNLTIGDKNTVAQGSNKKEQNNTVIGTQTDTLRKDTNDNNKGQAMAEDNKKLVDGEGQAHPITTSTEAGGSTAIGYQSHAEGTDSTAIGNNAKINDKLVTYYADKDGNQTTSMDDAAWYKDDKGNPTRKPHVFRDADNNTTTTPQYKYTHTVTADDGNTYTVTDITTDASKADKDDNGNPIYSSSIYDNTNYLYSVQLYQSATNSIAAGTNVTANGNNAVAVGYNSTADNSAVAVGDTANASGESSIAAGTKATASGTNATAVGSTSTASGDNTIAIGTGAKATDSSDNKYGSIAIGKGIEANGSSTAVGLNGTKASYGSSAYGNNATANGGSAAVGNNVTAEYGSSAFGSIVSASYGSYASGMGKTDNGKNVPVSATSGSYATGMNGTLASSGSMAVGNNVSATYGAYASGMGGTSAANGSMAVGNNVRAGKVGDNDYDRYTDGSAFAIGMGGTSADNKGMAVGNNVSADGENSYASGTNGTSATNGGTAYGNDVHANSYSSFAAGLNGTSTTATDSIAVGSNVHAYGYNSFAAGTNGTHTNGAYSVAIGTNNTSADDGSIAVGNNATADDSNSLALGTSVTAKQGALALGHNTNANYMSTAIGDSANASFNNSLALGNSAVAGVDGGIALGSNSTAYRESGQAGLDTVSGALSSSTEPAWKSTYGAISVGNFTRSDDGKTVTVNSTRQIVGVAAGTEDTDAVNVAQLKAALRQTGTGTIHDYSVNSANTTTDTNYNYDADTGSNALAAGVSAKATGVRSVAVGNGAKAQGADSIAIGTNAIATGQGAMVIGQYNTAEGQNSLAFGGGYNDANKGNKASSTAAVAFGEGSWAVSEGSVAFGYGTQAGNTITDKNGKYTGQNAVAFGNGTKALGGRSLAFGENTTANFNDSVAFGNGATAFSSGATAFGNRSRALSQYATSFGDNSVAAGSMSFAFGTDTIAGAALDDNGALELTDGSRMDSYGNMAYTTIDAGGNKTTYSIKGMKIPSGGDIHDYVVVTGTKADGTKGTYVEDYQGGIAEVKVNDDGTVTKVKDLYSGKLGGWYQYDENGKLVTNAKGTPVVTPSAKMTSIPVTLDKATPGSNGYTLKDFKNATAFGYSTEASGVNATAFGNDTKAKAAAATAFGTTTIASGVNATAFGLSTTASGDNATAFGEGSTASGEAATAFGISSTASGKNSLAALGGTASNENSIAIGKDTKANNADKAVSVAIGQNAEASGAQSLAIGFGNISETNQSGNTKYPVSATQAAAKGAIAIGINTGAIGEHSIAMGSYTDAAKDSSVAIGFDTHTVSDSAVAIGSGTKAAGRYSVALGLSSIAGTETNDEKNPLDGGGSVAMGYAASAEASRSIAIGTGATAADSQFTTAVGDSTTAQAEGSVAIGAGSIATRGAGNKESTASTDVNTGKTTITYGDEKKAYLKPDNLSTDKASTWVSTTGAVSVGGQATYKEYDDTGKLVKKTKLLTRQITNVAAGSDDTDAVNVAQLKAAQPTVTSNDHSVTINTTTDSTDYHKIYDLKIATATLSQEKTKGDKPVETGKVTVTNPTYKGSDGKDVTNENAYVTGNSVADAINKSGFNLTASASEGTVTGNKETLIHPGDTVTIDAGKNISLTQENGKISIATKDKLVLGKDTSDGKDGQEGTLGLTGKDGLPGADGKQGYSTTIIKTEKGQPGADGKNGKPGVDGTDITRIVYTDKDGNNPQTVATMDDGLKFVGNDGKDVTRKLNETLSIKGGITDANALKNASSKNLGVRQNEKEDGGEDGLEVVMTDTPDFTKVTVGEGTNPDSKITIGKQTVTGKKADGSDADKPQTGNYITGLDNKAWDKDNIVENRAATEGQLKDAINDIKGSTNGGFGLAAEKGGSVKKDLGQTITVKGDTVYAKDGKTVVKDGNIKTSVDDDAIQISLNDQISIGQKGADDQDGKDGKVTVETKGGTTVIIGHNGKDGEDGKDGLFVTSPSGKDGKDGNAGVSITGPNGKDGKDGVDGKVGIAGKDGKDAVSIAGKDGVGHIGLTGPKGEKGADGTPGRDGTSIDISTDYGTKTLDSNKNVMVDNKEQASRIIYNDAKGPHEVATMDDGLKIGANAASKEKAANPVSNKLNSTINIMGSAAKDGHTYTDDNLTTTVEQDAAGNTTVKVLMDKDITGNSVTVGKDSKDGEAGKDGYDGQEGSIGIAGKNGIDGKDGKQGITTTIIKTEKGQNGKDGEVGKQGAPGVDGKDITRIVYQNDKNNNDKNEDGKHVVATLDDGLKFIGDDSTATPVTKKLNDTLQIRGDGTYDAATKTNNGNIQTSVEDGTIKVALNKNINLHQDGSLTIGGDKQDGSTTVDDPIVIKHFDDKTLDVITGVDKDGKPISANKKAAAGDYATGLDNKEWNVNNPEYVSGRAATEDQLKKVSDAINKTAGQHTIVTVNDKDEHETKAEAGKGAFGKYAGTDKDNLLIAAKDDNGQLTYNIKLNDQLTIGQKGEPGKPGTPGKDGKVTVETKGGTTVVIGHDGKDGDNGKDGLFVTGKDGKDGKSGVSIIGPNGKDGNAGVDGKVGIAGKDGKDAVSISGKDGVGHIGLTGPKGEKGADGTDGRDGISIDITTDLKTATLDDGKNVKTVIKDKDGKETTITQAPRIQYDSNGKNYEVATMDDGLKIGANAAAQGKTANPVSNKLNSTIKIIGSTAKEKHTYTDDNLTTTVEQDADGNTTVKVLMDKDITGNSVTVGRDGKDGQEGSIGIAGKNGIDGENGKQGITTTIIKTEKGQNGKDGEIGKQGAPGVDGKDITRIVYQNDKNNNDKNEDGKHVVATLDDGLKFIGDDSTATPVTKKLNSTLQIRGDGTYDEKNNTVDKDGNIQTSVEDGTIKVALNKDINLKQEGSLTVGGDTQDGSKTVQDPIVIKHFDDKTLEITGVDKDGNPISANKKAAAGDYATGLDNKAWNVNNPEYVSGRAATEDQLKTISDAVNKAASTAGMHTVVTVNDKENETTAPVGTDGKYGTYSDSTKGNLLIAAKDENGKTTYNIKLNDQLTIGQKGEKGEQGQPGTPGKDGKVTVETKGGTTVVIGHDGKDGDNGKDGLFVTGKDGKDGKSGVSITGPNGANGADGVDGKVGIAGKDGKDAVSIAGKDGVGHIGLTGPKGEKGADGTPGRDGISIDITTDLKAPTLDDGKNVKTVIKDKEGRETTIEQAPRIQYKNGDNTYEVATMDDGLKFVGNDGQEVIRKLNTTLSIKGGITDATALKNASAKNLGVRQNADKDGLEIVMTDTPDFTKVTVGGDKKITIGGQPNTDTKNPTNGNYITGLDNTRWDKDHVTENRAATEGQLRDIAGSITNQQQGGGFALTSDEKGADKIVKQDLGKAIQIKGDTTYKTDGTVEKAGNIKTSIDNGAIKVELNKDVDLTKDGSIKAGETTINKGGVDTNKITIKDSTISISKDGINGGGKQITNVASGASEITTGADGKVSYKYDNETNAANIGDVKRITGDMKTEINNNVTEVNNKVNKMGDELTQVQKDVKADRTYQGDDGAAKKVKVKFGSFLSLTGGAKLADLTEEGNIGVVQKEIDDPDHKGEKIAGLSVRLAKHLNLEKTTYTSNENGQTYTSEIDGKGLTIKTGDKNRNITVQDGNVNIGGNQIHNVAPGQAPGDAVNVSQLNATNQTVANLGGAVNKLGTRVNRVGAGAAALAALHPLDFDPDDKWDFAAGYGNYKDASAVAVGAYYRPNEDTMFSVGGSFGGGENMVNAGVSFKVGQGNHVSTSRVAMAKEIKDLRQDVANLNAIVNRQSALIDKLTGTNAGTIQDTGNDLFPDVPANHWAYEYVTKLKQAGILTGYPDGNFDGDRMMTRYEFAAIVYRAIMAGAASNPALSQDGTLDKLAKEFSPEMKHIRIDTIAKDKNGKPTIERVRVIPEAKQ